MFDKERSLEHKYSGVLAFTEAKGFLKQTCYTTGKINGVIRRFVNAEKVGKPANFADMESFVADLADFWIDANPEVHEDGEFTLHRVLSNYLAFSTVWKAKSQTSSILDPDLMKQVGFWLHTKNALGHMATIIPSMAKRIQNFDPKLVESLKEATPLIFQSAYETGLGIARGEYLLPEGQTQEDFARLAGAFYAGHPVAIGAVESLKQLEYDKETSKSLLKEPELAEL